MDDPVAEIAGLVKRLCTAPLVDREKAIRKYFTPDARFIHPICRTSAARAEVASIYSWYQVLCPDVSIEVESVAFDKAKRKLYVTAVQQFRVWILPRLFYPRESFQLVTVLNLDLVDEKWYIAQQNDLYQTDQWVAFVVPWVGRPLVLLFAWIAGLLCVMGTWISGPLHLRRGKVV